MGSSHLIRNVMWWKLRWCQKTCVREKMVPNYELFESIPLHGQRLNCETNVYELEDHVGEKGWNSNYSIKLGLLKKTHFISFSSRLLKSVWVNFAFHYVLLPHHNEAKQDTIGVAIITNAKLPHYTNLMLIYPMQNEMSFVHHVVKVVGMWLYRWEWQKLKWKDLKTSNVET